MMIRRPHKSTTQPFLLLLSLMLFTLRICGDASGQQPPPVSSADRDRGIQLFKEGNFKDSIKVLNEAVKKNKDDSEAWYFLGLANTRVDDWKRARSAFENAVKQLPNFALAHTGFAYALVQTGRDAEAGREATRALELNDQDGEAHYVLGVVRMRQRKNDVAQKEADAAIRLRPQLAAAYLLKSQAILAVYGESAAMDSRVVDANVSRSLESGRIEAQKNSALLKEAADALQTYLKLIPSGDSAATWREQLETLQVFSGAQSDVVPSAQVTVRARVLSKPEPTYTERARMAGIEGTVILRAVFSSDGVVRHILIMRSLPYGLTEQAIAAARKIKFVPAMKDGKPVSMIFQLEYNFNLY
jgi:TonB family protein